jgi:hypothetical protein
MAAGKYFGNYLWRVSQFVWETFVSETCFRNFVSETFPSVSSNQGLKRRQQPWMKHPNFTNKVGVVFAADDIMCVF